MEHQINQAMILTTNGGTNGAIDVAKALAVAVATKELIGLLESMGEFKTPVGRMRTQANGSN